MAVPRRSPRPSQKVRRAKDRPSHPAGEPPSEPIRDEAKKY